MKKFVFSMGVFAACSAALAATQIFISPNGSDTGGNGTRQSPYGSLARAKAALKSAPRGDVEIVACPGEYFIRKGVSFSASDLKGINLSIVGEADKDGNRPVFIGGGKLPASALKEVTDKAVLAKIPSDAEGKLFYIDLKAAGVSDYGKMQQRGFGTNSRPTEMEAFLDMRPLTNAQYPNDERIMKIGEVLDEGHVRAIAFGQGAYKPKPDKNIRGATFKYVEPRTARWAGAPEAFIRGNLSVGWADDQIKIKKIDVQAGTIELETPHIYGVWSCVPDKDGKIKPGDVAVRGFQVYNLLEELDRNGEYYIDRQNGIFYVMLAKRPGEGSSFYFSVLSEPFISFRDVSNARLSGINFAVSRWEALRMTSCSECVVDSCDFFNSGLGPNISGRKCKLLRSRVYNCALGGARIYGGNRKTLERGDNLMENCELFNNARLRMNYSPALGMGGVGNTVRNCDFHDHPHVCIQYSGNDMLIERNTFVRCCKGSSDMGVTYTGRNQSDQGNVIRRNFFSQNLPPDPGAMMCGVYVDDGSGGTLIENNIFCHTGSIGHSSSFGAVYYHGGCDNIARENVFIACESGVGQQTWTNERWAAALKREAHRFYKEVDVNSEVYKKRYPKLAKLFDPEAPRENFTERNKVFCTPMSLNGNMILRNNKPLKPNKGISCAQAIGVKFWTLDLVNKYFGEDPLVKKNLKLPIGVQKD